AGAECCRDYILKMPVSTNPCRPRLEPGKSMMSAMANACGTTWRLGDRTPTQATEGIVSQQLVAIVSTDGVANAGGTTWVRGSNPRGYTIWGHSSGVEQCFPNSCRHIPHKKIEKCGNAFARE